MSNLILPSNLQRIHRPLAHLPTEDLFNELQQRSLLAELKGEIRMPHGEVAMMTDEVKEEVRKAQFSQLATQLGMAAAGSPFALTGVRTEPAPEHPDQEDEILVLAVLLAMHPEMIRRMPGPAANVIPG